MTEAMGESARTGQRVEVFRPAPGALLEMLGAAKATAGAKR